jgi:hypothetical protein
MGGNTCAYYCIGEPKMIGDGLPDADDEAGWHWSGSSQRCEPNTRITLCASLPAHAEWSGSGTIEQTWTDF